MPNWCDNDLEITGNKKYIDDFLEKSKGEDTMFCFSGLLPMPDGLKDTTAPCRERENETSEEFEIRKQSSRRQYGAVDWYEWNISNWGTKWDVHNVEYDRNEDDFVFMWFSTAWSPPVKYIEKVSLLYPDLTFKLGFMEGGCDFEGHVLIQNGETLEDVCHEVWYYKVYDGEIEIEQDCYNDNDPSEAMWEAERYLRNNPNVPEVHIKYNDIITDTITQENRRNSEEASIAIEKTLDEMENKNFEL